MTSTPTSCSGSTTMRDDVDTYRTTPPCALHRTFKKKFNKPSVAPAPPVKVSQAPKPENVG
jgi:hypothetical protein